MRAAHLRLLLDSNLLVLLIVGVVNPARIRQFKRTSGYTFADFELPAGIVDQAETLYTTPHILTEQVIYAICPVLKVKLRVKSCGSGSCAAKR